jgi:UDP-GlcNAc3NAcA epimerase
MIKLLTIIGARPQIIKSAAINRAVQKQFSQQISEIIVHTGQHYDQNMSEVFFEEMNIPKPDYNLGVGSGTHGVQTARMIEGIEDLLLKEKPDYINLYGDTNSTLAGAVAASKLNIPIVHVEAGLRSFNRTMPEEINRITCDHLSTLLFSPTKTGFDNLVREGFNPNNEAPFIPENPGIFHCGDVMYDNSLYFAELASEKSKILEEAGVKGEAFVLATVHRDHNTDNPQKLAQIFEAFLEIAANYKIVLPLHPRTLKMLQHADNKGLYENVKNESNLKIIPPVSFFDIIQLEQNAKMIVTDSGGVQKEAYFFQKPCIILRPQTEWVEILDTGLAVLTDANKDKILEAYQKFENISTDNFPAIFGDGKAAEFICGRLV